MFFLCVCVQILMILSVIEIIFMFKNIHCRFGVNKSFPIVKITIHRFVFLKSAVLFKIWPYA